MSTVVAYYALKKGVWRRAVIEKRQLNYQGQK